MPICSAISNWWDGQLDGLQQAVFIIGCAATLVVVIQFIMLLCGLGGDAGFDGDADADVGDGTDLDTANDEGVFDAGGLKLLSFRSVIAFIAVGCWVIYTLEFFVKAYISVPVGVLAGAAAGVGIAFLMRAMMRFRADGTRQMRYAIGKVADVYLHIPAARTGSGKIQVVVQETLTECDAVTDSTRPIPTGARCVVKDVINEQLVLVEPFVPDESAAKEPKDEA